MLKSNPLFWIVVIPAMVVGSYMLYSKTHYSAADALGPTELAKLADGNYYTVEGKLKSEGELEKYDATIYVKKSSGANPQSLRFKGYITSKNIAAKTGLLTFYPLDDSCKGSKIEFVQDGETTRADLSGADESCNVAVQIQGSPVLIRIN
jgi:hypothetical protein